LANGSSIDFRFPPLTASRRQWIDPHNYLHCQQLARKAMKKDIQIICYESVRDPASGGCAAVLSHVAFTESVPIENQTWTLAVFKHPVVWRQNSIFENDTFEFNADRWFP
jgi:hypothetical protein